MSYIELDPAFPGFKEVRFHHVVAICHWLAEGVAVGRHIARPQVFQQHLLHGARVDGCLIDHHIATGVFGRLHTPVERLPARARVVGYLHADYQVGPLGDLGRGQVDAHPFEILLGLAHHALTRDVDEREHVGPRSGNYLLVEIIERQVTRPTDVYGSRRAFGQAMGVRQDSSHIAIKVGV